MKKSYVFNTLICCGCTALIFLLHFIVYGGVLLKSPGYAVCGSCCTASFSAAFCSSPSRNRMTFCAGSAWYTAWFASFSSFAKEITARNRGLRRS